jgi:hypothetical protein
VSSQLLSRRRLNALSRKYLLPFTAGVARGERWYWLHTFNHTIYYLQFSGTRPGRRKYVLSGPHPPECGRWRPCRVNGAALVVDPKWPGELTWAEQER